MPRVADITSNLTAVRRRINAAAQRVDRNPAGIQLIAVSKTFSADDVRAAFDAGHRAFGENRVQEGLGKMASLEHLSLEWHLIGHLQSNKAKKAVSRFGWIHSVDSAELLGEIAKEARRASVRPRVLIQVDLAGEATKHGAPEDAAPRLVQAAAAEDAVNLRGLMIVPPFPEQPEESRPWFRKLRELRDRLLAMGVPADHLADLSMGMSHDFEIAVEEGATMVRVGTAIFGHRPAPVVAE